MQPEERRAFLAALPRKRIAAGALIRDRGGRVLLVEPTYQPGWLLPGGLVEIDEAPSTGARREVLEELGLSLLLGRLLVMDWARPRDDDPYGALLLVYDGGVLGDDEIVRISCPPAELRGFRFVPTRDLDQFLDRRNQVRVITALRALDSGETAEIT